MKLILHRWTYSKFAAIHRKRSIPVFQSIRCQSLSTTITFAQTIVKGSSSIDHIRRLAIPSNLGKRRVASRRVVSSISSLEIIGVVASSLLLAFLGIVDFHETLKVATPYSIYDARVHDDLSLPTARGDKLATRFINFGALFFFSFFFCWFTEKHTDRRMVQGLAGWEGGTSARKEYRGLSRYSHKQTAYSPLTSF